VSMNYTVTHSKTHRVLATFLKLEDAQIFAEASTGFSEQLTLVIQEGAIIHGTYRQGERIAK